MPINRNNIDAIQRIKMLETWDVRQIVFWSSFWIIWNILSLYFTSLNSCRCNSSICSMHRPIWRIPCIRFKKRFENKRFFWQHSRAWGIRWQIWLSHNDKFFCLCLSYPNCLQKQFRYWENFRLYLKIGWKW